MTKEKQDLLEVFNKIKPLIKKYEPKLVARMDYESRYELWSERECFAFGKKRTEMFFAGLIIQSNYVGFYYMPVYANPQLKKVFKPELLKLLKGKSCFHIKQTDTLLIKQIKDVLKIGFSLYKKNKWA